MLYIILMVYKILNALDKVSSFSTLVSSFTPNSSGELDILGHDSNTLGIDGTHIY